MHFDTTRCYRLLECLHLKEDGEQLLVLDARTYTVHELNESAAIVARLCDGSRSCEQMVASIVTSYHSAPLNAAEIVYRGLKLLDDQGLLEAA
jgi:hypothetical protein